MQHGLIFYYICRMKKILTLTALLLSVLATETINAQTKTTLKFAQRDTCDLFLDLYMPTDTALLAENKPLILFAFGGGFYSGERDAKDYIEWFNALNAKGYPVASMDYRLGLKGVKYAKNLKFVAKLEHAVDIAVEDMYSATNYLLENAKDLCLEGRGIVISGSSAGAMTSLQAEYYIANDAEIAKVLPEGFNYAGVMSFSGAVFSKKGNVTYAKTPCPQLLLHGMLDRMVTYKQIKMLGMCLGGSSHIAKQLAKAGYNYQILRFTNNYHEICVSMMRNLDKELEFLSRNVEKGENIIIDAVITDPEIKIPDWATTPAVE